MIPRFRAWDKEGNRMILPKYLYSIDLLKERVTERTKCNYTFSLHSIPFDKVELMQSTGLEDKNNKEIFEGDIVRMRNPRDRRQIGMFQVVRVANSPMLGLLDKKLTTEIFNLYEHMRNYYEIIGNIYENPELLKEER